MSSPSLVGPSLRNVKRILLIHARGGLGDVLLSTPVLDALKRRYPQASIDMMVREAAAPLVRNHPSISEVLAVPDGHLDQGRTWRRWLHAVQKRDYSLGIVLWSKAPEAWLLFRSGIRHRVGQDSRLMYSWTYTRRVRVRSEHGDHKSHWVQCLLDYARAVGGDVEHPEPRFVLSETARDEARQVLADHGVDLDQKRVVLSVGRGTPLTPERIPTQPFAQLSDALTRALQAQVVLTGSKAEADVLKAVASQCQEPVFNLAGALHLEALGAVLEQAAVVVANDSGPMHMAAAVGSPTVGLFAMEKDLPTRWGPWGPACEVFRPEQFVCEPHCLKETCSPMRCYEALDPEAIVEAARRCIERGANPETVCNADSGA